MGSGASSTKKSTPVMVKAAPDKSSNTIGDDNIQELNGNVKTVALTGGAGQIAYSLIPHICNGAIFGSSTLIKLHILDIPQAVDSLRGVKMEIQDSGLPLVVDIVTTTDPTVAFKDADVAILVGGFPRKKGMERKDMIEKNADIMKMHGEAIQAVGSSDVKILVVANPANTNALMISKFAPKVPAKNITCLTRLDHDRLHGLLVEKIKEQGVEGSGNVTLDQVRNGIIWGNHSATQYPDYRGCEVQIGGTWKKVADLITDGAWLSGGLTPLVQKRGAEIINARKLSSAMSAASAIKNHLRDWLFDTPEGVHVSMGVMSDGNPYGIEEGLMFSFPVRCRGGEWEFVSGFTDLNQEMINSTAAELKEERALAGEILGQDFSVNPASIG